MKIALVLGNGFDIKIGINTRYTDFYKYFLSNHVTGTNTRYYAGDHSVLVQMLQNRYRENWSDLERLFGETIKEFPSVSAIKKEKEFLEQSINDYLVREQNRVMVRDEYYKELKVQLDTILVQMLRIGGVEEAACDNSVDILTFNYTDVVDRIFTIANKEKEGLFAYSSVKHIHGQTDNTLILGVDNASQYDYQLLRGAELLDTVMLKPALNNLLRRGCVESIIESIQKADVVVIYGSSIGYTDSTWWRIISRWLNDEDDHKVLIYGYVGSSAPASATAQLGLSDYVDRFYRCSCHVGNNNIQVHKCESWMFSFDESIIEVV